VIETWANNLPLFDDDKTYELFKINNRKELEKVFPRAMLSIKYKKSL